jgi:spore germination protein
MKNVARFSKAIIILLIFFVLAIVFVFINSVGKKVVVNKISQPLPQPEISGWVAWWKEEQAYDLIEKYQGKIKNVSPVWFIIGDDYKLANVGKIDRRRVIADLKKEKIKVLPTLGTELTAEKLSRFLNNERLIDNFIFQLTNEIISLNTNGIDIDIENIKRQDRDKFTLFLSKLSAELVKNNLLLSVTVNAQTANEKSEEGSTQDLKKIGKIASEVRIMVYDKHSAASGPGAIAPLDWAESVVSYSTQFVDINKIVIGIPSYGYIWTNNKDASGLQYDEFRKYLENKKYSQSVNGASGETVVNGNDFVGWLSDSQAMIKKIENLRKNGINKFIIWNLGGMDSSFFEKIW